MNAKVKFQPKIFSAQIKTSEGSSFHTSGHVNKEQFLFSVTPGVELMDALNSISDLLSLIREPIFDAGMGEALQDNAAWRVYFVFEAAKAGVDSLISTLVDEEVAAGLNEVRIA